MYEYHGCHPIGQCKLQDTSLIMTTEISWRPTEDTEIHTVEVKGSSRRRKEEMEKKNKNEK